MQSEYESKLPEIAALEHRGQYDEALACLDAILDAHRERDHDRWLARSIADHRLLILLDAGRYAEAEEAAKTWAQLGFADVSQRWMHALGTAHTLEALGRDREAVAALEDALGHEDPNCLPSVLGVLTELVRISAKISRPVDSRWLSIAAAVAERYGVKLPLANSPEEAILALQENVEGKLPKRPNE